MQALDTAPGEERSSSLKVCFALCVPFRGTGKTKEQLDSFFVVEADCIERRP